MSTISGFVLGSNLHHGVIQLEMIYQKRAVIQQQWHKQKSLLVCIPTLEYLRIQIKLTWNPDSVWWHWEMYTEIFNKCLTHCYWQV